MKVRILATFAALLLAAAMVLRAPDSGTQHRAQASSANPGPLALGCSAFGDCDHDGSNALFSSFYGDGCPDAEEPAHTYLGFPLNPTNPWDFYSVPVPALYAALSPTTDFRTNTISAAGATAVFAYFTAGAKLGNTLYNQDLNLNGVMDGLEYDRSVSAGLPSAPDGVFSVAEAQKEFSEFAQNLKCTTGTGYRTNGP